MLLSINFFTKQTQSIVEDIEVTVNPLKEFTAKLKDSFQVLYGNQVTKTHAQHCSKRISTNTAIVHIVYHHLR